MLINGSCHCGNVSFTYALLSDPAEIPARACACSFCVKHGGVWTGGADGSLTINVEDWAQVSRYAFETCTSRFHVCGRCGVVPLVTCTIDEQLYAVVSVNTFNGVDAALFRRGSVSFDGETTEDRLARRKRGWIAEVRYVTAPPE